MSSRRIRSSSESAARPGAPVFLKLLFPLLLACSATGVQAAALRVCDRGSEPTPAQKDRMLRFGAIVKDELERSGQDLAIVARSGLDLGRIGVRYSHAGISLKSSANSPWSVRQLYFACEESRPRIFDQGMAGFIFGTDDPSLGYLSIVYLPRPAADDLARAALDDRRALALLGPAYSANAYAFGLRYQNCNQWVMELLATAWGALDGTSTQARARAQHWLANQDYRPTEFRANGPLAPMLAKFVPHLHDDDHPAERLGESVWQVSMPQSIEDFVRTTVPGTRRVELCHTNRHVVIRRGWSPIEAGCIPADGDTVIALD